MTAAYRFFLGGADLEMTVIAELARGALGPDAVVDRGLGWGAKASAHADAIAACAGLGITPVLVELGVDIDLPANAIVVDHHNERAGGPTSLHQVFDLLALPPERWTRWHTLVAANDAGHVAAMQAMSASAEEITRVRAADRAAQGITAGEEAAGAHAVDTLETALDGTLLVARLPHARTATVTDPLAIRGETRDLVVLSPASVNFFGDGARIARLDAAFPGGWRGGELPRRGFWGLGQPLALAEVTGALR